MHRLSPEHREDCPGKSCSRSAAPEMSTDLAFLQETWQGQVAGEGGAVRAEKFKVRSDRRQRPR